ncbi:MAG: Sua5/YciO/YrdC/YwlC family protein [Chitinophagales bacterium]|nr:Sua5/YciO/YrdC/YwlC family protein [Chitinophagales bacterium]
MADFEADVKQAVVTLNDGGVILYPTDTIWGLGCDAFNATAVDKVFALKNRPKEKSLIILLAEAKDILQYVAAPHPDIIDIVQSFERPTTVIYDHALGFPDNVVHENGSIGIRVTTDAFCKSLIKRLGRPIISTSANVSGAPSAAFYGQIDQHIISGADYVVQYRQDDTTPVQASRIVKINDDGSLDIIRA